MLSGERRREQLHRRKKALCESAAAVNAAKSFSQWGNALFLSRHFEILQLQSGFLTVFVQNVWPFQGGRMGEGGEQAGRQATTS